MTFLEQISELHKKSHNRKLDSGCTRLPTPKRRNNRLDVTDCSERRKFSVNSSCFFLVARWCTGEHDFSPKQGCRISVAAGTSIQETRKRLTNRVPRCVPSRTVQNFVTVFVQRFTKGYTHWAVLVCELRFLFCFAPANCIFYHSSIFNILCIFELFDVAFSSSEMEQKSAQSHPAVYTHTHTHTHKSTIPNECRWSFSHATRNKCS